MAWHGMALAFTVFYFDFFLFPAGVMNGWGYLA